MSPPLLALRKQQPALVGRGGEGQAVVLDQLLQRQADRARVRLERRRDLLAALARVLLEMRQQRIRYAFAFDSHFATAGFIRIPIDFQLSP